MSDNSNGNPYSVLAAQFKELKNPLTQLKTNYDKFKNSFEGERIDQINTEIQKVNYSFTSATTVKK